MKQFIEALQIFLKYEGCDLDYPFHCEHDELSICIDPEKISSEDIAKLEELGIHADYDEERFYSYKYGSC